MRYFAKITTTFALALVFSAGMAFGQNDGEIDQTGDDNSATIDQAGASESMVTQDGVGNEADVAQEAFGGPGHDTDIKQVGNLNEADVTSRSGNGLQGFGGNELDIRQDGNRNTFETPTMQGSDMDFDVEQVGNRNYASIETRYGAGGSPGDSEVNIIQKFGNRNSGIISAESGGNNHFLQIKQKFGDSNTASITHKVSGESGVDGIVGKVTQWGNSNDATIDLYGETSDRAVVTQDGNSNYATIEHN